MVLRKLRISNEEGLEILKAWVAISLAFGIVLSNGWENVLSSDFIMMLILAGLTVGVGFLAHELCHKLVAQKYGCWAEFRAFNGMLVLAVLMSFFGFVFAVPGAVFIRGYVNVERNGKISLAGPLTNFVLAGLCLILLGIVSNGFIGDIFRYGFLINTWLGLFNMIPVWNLDGAKVLRWNKSVFWGMIIVGLVFLFGGF